MGDSDCVAVEGDKVSPRHLGKMLEVDGQFYNIEVARDGAFIKLQKAENVVLGQVRVPETISEFVAYRRERPFRAQAGERRIHLAGRQVSHPGMED